MKDSPSYNKIQIVSDKCHNVDERLKMNVLLKYIRHTENKKRSTDIY